MTRKSLDTAALHVAYEVAEMARQTATFVILSARQVSGEDLSFEERVSVNALLEAQLLHLRNLMEFLGRGPSKKYLRASDYLPTWRVEEAKRSIFDYDETVSFDQVYGTLCTYLDHLGASRGSREYGDQSDQPMWNLQAVQGVVRCFTEFVSDLEGSALGHLALSKGAADAGRALARVAGRLDPRAIVELGRKHPAVPHSSSHDPADPALSDSEWTELHELRRVQHRWCHAAMEYESFANAKAAVAERSPGEDSAAAVPGPVAELKVRRRVGDIITDKVQGAFEARAEWAEELAVIEAVTAVNPRLAMNGPTVRATHPPELPSGDDPILVVQLLAVADHFETSSRT